MKDKKTLQEIINYLEVMNDKEVIKFGNTLYNQGKKELLNDIRKMQNDEEVDYLIWKQVK
tara:strand:- start:792 stop:971 length:180 start_codon:yes stop_codon:yes gene_type:complete